MKKTLLALLLLPSLAFGMRAQVIQSTPIYDNYSYTDNRCTVQYVEKRDNGMGTLIGALIGGAVGNALPTSGGRQTNTVIGALAGGVVGNDVTSGIRQVQVCNPEIVTQTRIVGYDVRFKLENGQEFVQRMNYDPGIGNIRSAQITIR